MKVTKLPSSTNKFKVGQIVEYKGTGILMAEKGAKAIIISIDHAYIDLKWIRNRLAHEQNDGGYFPTDFDVVVMAPKMKLNFLHKNKFISNLQYLEALSEK